jgi:hypothetical protein
MMLSVICLGDFLNKIGKNKLRENNVRRNAQLFSFSSEERAQET